MKSIKNLGMIVLGIWLVATGLLRLLDVTFPAGETLLAAIAMLAGLLIVLRPAVQPKKWGMILLSVWLILVGLLPLLGAGRDTSDTILGLLAIIAGIVLLLGR
jgi:FtsH-binding integral membrane protein